MLSDGRRAVDGVEARLPRSCAPCEIDSLWSAVRQPLFFSLRSAHPHPHEAKPPSPSWHLWLCWRRGSAAHVMRRRREKAALFTPASAEAETASSTAELSDVYLCPMTCYGRDGDGEGPAEYKGGHLPPRSPPSGPSLCHPPSSSLLHPAQNTPEPAAVKYIVVTLLPWPPAESPDADVGQLGR